MPPLRGSGRRTTSRHKGEPQRASEVHGQAGLGCYELTSYESIETTYLLPLASAPLQPRLSLQLISYVPALSLPQRQGRGWREEYSVHTQDLERAQGQEPAQGQNSQHGRGPNKVKEERQVARRARRRGGWGACGGGGGGGAWGRPRRRGWRPGYTSAWISIISSVKMTAVKGIGGESASASLALSASYKPDPEPRAHVNIIIFF